MSQLAVPREFEKLFEPLRVKNLVLKNRIVLPAIVNNYGTPDGFATQGLIDFHVERAGAGMNIVGLSLVRPFGGVAARHLKVLDEKFIPGLAKLAQAIKDAGSAALIQIGDIGARAGSWGGDADPIAPSPLTLGSTEARELSASEIKDLVTVFAGCAERTYRAGFDGVEFHGAHFYLISEFLSPHFNKRTDAYGGSVRNRSRFILEIVEETRSRVPDDFLVLVRINSVEPVENGLDMEQVKQIGQLLEAAGVDIIDLSNISQAAKLNLKDGAHTYYTSTIPKDWPEGRLVKYAAELKQAVKVPVITVGKIYSPSVAEQILRNGQADLVAMARAMIADPQLPAKILEGRIGEIVRCKEDIACLESVSRGKAMMCSVNRCLPRKKDLIKV